MGAVQGRDVRVGGEVVSYQYGTAADGGLLSGERFVCKTCGARTTPPDTVALNEGGRTQRRRVRVHPMLRPAPDLS